MAGTTSCECEGALNYCLVVLTHGPCEGLVQTLASFYDMVTPRPSQEVLVHDGAASFVPPAGMIRERYVRLEDSLGFCDATRRAWQEGVSGGMPYVFHLEHDFVFRRCLDLRLLAEVLEAHSSLAQMALMRDSVNHEEMQAGGVIAKHQGWGDVFERREWKHCSWIEHNAYFTTNPSLMRRDFLQQNALELPSAPACEGKFTIMLRDLGYGFGIWGDGTPWVKHFGRRTRLGIGY